MTIQDWLLRLEQAKQQYGEQASVLFIVPQFITDILLARGYNEAVPIQVVFQAPPEKPS